MRLAMGSFSIWHWLVVLVVVGIFAAPIFWMRMASNRSQPGKLKGFGGWLALLAYGIYLGPLISLSKLLRVGDGIDAATGSRIYIAFDSERGTLGILLVMQIALIARMMQKSHRFLFIFYLTFGYMAMLIPIDALCVREPLINSLSTRYRNVR